MQRMWPHGLSHNSHYITIGWIKLIPMFVLNRDRIPVNRILEITV